MAETDRVELTLKSIYQLLTRRDYLSYSNGVIPEKDRRGLTIISFWREMILPEWKEGKYGRMIWRDQEHRSRYASELIHRRDSFPCYLPWMREIMDGMTPDRFYRQMAQFRRFLTQRHYRSSVLRDKVDRLMALCREGDACFPVDLADDLVMPRQREDLAPEMLDSWMLTMLFLHACAGPEMKHPSLQAMRKDARYAPWVLAQMDQGLGKVVWQVRAMQAIVSCVSENYDIAELEDCIRQGMETGMQGEEMTTLCLWGIPCLAERAESRGFARESVDRLREMADTPILRILSYGIDLSAAMEEGDPHQALTCFLGMKEEFEQNPDPRLAPLVHKCWTNTVFLLYALKEETERAEELYQEYEAQRSAFDAFDQEILRLRMMAARDIYENRADLAVAHTRELMNLVEKRSGRNNRTWLISRYDLALFLRKSGQIRESVELYEEMVSEGDQEIMNPDYYPLVLVNAGVAWMEYGGEDRAMALLDQAADLSRRRKDAFSLAQADYWLAVAWKKQGDAEREKEHLLSARGFFENQYGPEHEKNQYIKERMRALGIR